MTAPATPRASVLAHRDFRWLLAGSGLSMLGDQFTLVALPWAVLQATRDPLALGAVVAAAGLPRAALLLVGGAMVDRGSPRTVLWQSRLASAVLVALMAGGAAAGVLSFPLLLALSAAIGIVTAFGHPAGSALLPQVVPGPQLVAANGLVMAVRQVGMLVGPALAGVAIATLGATGQGATRGVVLAFTLDAASFAFSAWTVARLPRGLVTATATATAADPAAAAGATVAPHPRPSLGADIAASLRALWQDVPLRTLLLYVAAVAFFVGGPIQVALPVLAAGMPQGAAAFGLLLTGHGLGVLAGMALAAARPHWRLGTLGWTLLVIDATSGAAFVLFGHVHALWQGLLLLAPLGALGGFVQVAVVAWLQRRVPPQRLGRTMSLFMLLLLGLAPLASAVAGLALRLLAPAALFTASGLALLAIVLVGAVVTPIRQIGDDRAA